MRTSDGNAVAWGIDVDLVDTLGETKFREIGMCQIFGSERVPDHGLSR